MEIEKLFKIRKIEVIEYNKLMEHKKRLDKQIKDCKRMLKQLDNYLINGD